MVNIFHISHEESAKQYDAFFFKDSRSICKINVSRRIIKICKIILTSVRRAVLTRLIVEIVFHFAGCEKTYIGLHGHSFDPSGVYRKEEVFL